MGRDESARQRHVGAAIGDAVSDQKYILEGKELRPVSLLEWARWFEKADRRIAIDTIGESRVSTVFLGLDHRFGGGGPPLLFETMVFGGPLADDQDRYSTYEEAEAGHKRMVDRVRVKFLPEEAK